MRVSIEDLTIRPDTLTTKIPRGNIFSIEYAAQEIFSRLSHTADPKGRVGAVLNHLQTIALDHGKPGLEVLGRLLQASDEQTKKRLLRISRLDSTEIFFKDGNDLSISQILSESIQPLSVRPHTLPGFVSKLLSWVRI